MDQQKFINYYTELLNKNVQELFNKVLLLQTNEKLYIEELNTLRTQIENYKKTTGGEEIEALKVSNDVYREQLKVAQERIKELELTVE